MRRSFLLGKPCSLQEISIRDITYLLACKSERVLCVRSGHIPADKMFDTSGKLADVVTTDSSHHLTRLM